MTATARPIVKTMLLNFRAENVRSFRDTLELSLEATSLSEDDVPRVIPWREGETRSSVIGVLPAAGIFGANASGKTNVLRVMDDMRDFVMLSFRPTRKEKREPPLRHLRRPFRLDSQREAEPSTYEIDLIIDGVRHEYGFRVDDWRVLSEWAVRYPRGKAATIFRREMDHLDIKLPRASAVKQLLRPDTLFLSVARVAEYEPLKYLYGWFERNLILADASSRESRWRETLEIMAHEERRRQVLELIRVADLGITDAHPKNPDPEQLEQMRKFASAMREFIAFEGDEEAKAELFDADLDTVVGILLSHRAATGTVQFEASDESLGTLVWLGLIGPVLRALATGTVLLADEIESSLHPALVAELVTMFQKPNSNPRGAQLIFNTHEARLLGNSSTDRVIGRDQVWFTEKTHNGGSRLYPLSDLSPRKDEAIARRYLDGRYGGTPVLSHAEFTALAKLVASTASDDVE